MGDLFPHLSALGASLVLLFTLFLLWRRGIRAYIAAFVWQSVILAGVTALVGHFGHDRRLYLIAVLLFLLKAVAIPGLLRNMERRFGVGREVRPYVNVTASTLIAGILVFVAYSVTAPLVAMSQLPTRSAIPLAMGVVFVSLFIVVSRKKALTQIIGFLMLENGIALLAVLATYGVPLIVELGVFLDALMGFLVMQVFVYHIHATFESIDVDELNQLKH